MCRLFGLHAGERPVAATFWLLDAPDSLAEQSHRNPDGAGIGVFDPPHGPRVEKQPLAAWQDPEFARAARTLQGTTFVAHVRYASTGARTVANTHPFTQDGRLFAHNGVVEGLPELEQRLRELDARDLVDGDTDSERVFALVTAEIRRNGGDVQQGIVSALTWIADRLPVYSLNFLLTTGTDLYAVRYPATNELYLLAREPSGERLDAKSTRISAHSTDLADTAAVLIASEPMDADPDWRLLASGELVHIDAALAITRSFPWPNAPRHQMGLGDLDPVAAGSQHPTLPKVG
jgi:predicted glutamine amidotransferase